MKHTSPVVVRQVQINEVAAAAAAVVDGPVTNAEAGSTIDALIDTNCATLDCTMVDTDGATVTVKFNEAFKVESPRTTVSSVKTYTDEACSVPGLMTSPLVVFVIASSVTVFGVTLHENRMAACAAVIDDRIHELKFANVLSVTESVGRIVNTVGVIGISA